MPIATLARDLWNGALDLVFAPVCVACREPIDTADPERIVIVNRTGERARELAQRFGRGRTKIDVVASVDELGAGAFDLAVNATSLGLHAGDPLPLDPAAAPPIEAALDLVYARSGETAWVRTMSAHGIPTVDGTEMLLQQGAAAFRRWWSMDPPLDAMREALRG